jgi:hypothetical protein
VLLQPLHLPPSLQLPAEWTEAQGPGWPRLQALLLQPQQLLNLPLGCCWVHHTLMVKRQLSPACAIQCSCWLWRWVAVGQSTRAHT